MITLGHGAGGQLTRRLIESCFLPELNNPALSALLDAAVLDDLALTTDAYVVSPIFFPGGDLGRLALSGTVNDLAMVGARPLGIAAAFILEEGLDEDVLHRVVRAMAAAAEEAGVKVVAGDTKVVPRGACDGLFITTSGVGRLSPDFRPNPGNIRPGDAVIVSGTIADHGMGVMTARQGLSISGDITSDVAPLNTLVDALRPFGKHIRALRDPTRGGLAATANELAEACGATIALREAAIPIRPATNTACELLGIDPLHVANEGKLVAVVSDEVKNDVIQALRDHPLGRNAALIGEVAPGQPRVELDTALGTRRVVRLPEGEILPRIC
jgi:hydrogenase expression/formation protein HypE